MFIHQNVSEFYASKKKRKYHKMRIKITIIKNIIPYTQPLITKHMYVNMHAKLKTELKATIVKDFISGYSTLNHSHQFNLA